MQRTLQLFPRQLLALLTPVAIAMLLSWGAAVWLYSDALENRVAAQLANVATAMARGNLPLSGELLDRLAELQGAEFLVTDRDGVVLLSTWANPPPALRAAAAEPGASAIRIGDTLWLIDTRNLSIMAPSRFARVTAAASLADTRVAARRAALALAAALAVALLVLGLILRRLVRGITEPMTQLAGAAHAVAAGGRNVTFPVLRDDEVGRLGAALNDMAARLLTYERALEERSRGAALGEISARIAHEIRNPLTGIKMHLQLLAERSPAERGTLVTLLDEVRRLELIVNATLALGRDAALNIEAVDVSALAGEVVHLMAPAFAHRAVTLELQAAQPADLQGDAGQLKQALLNLLVNAADALPNGGRIGVSVRTEGGRVLLTVEDSGPGMEEVNRAAKPLGLGIGLPLCREIVARHGGELRSSRSTRLGGACFMIDLPVSAGNRC